MSEVSEKKYCAKCKMVLSNDVMFCPECGGKVQIYSKPKSVRLAPNVKTNKKKLLVFGVITIAVIVVACIAFAVIQNLILKDSASNAKNNIANKIQIENMSESLGNLACNVCAEACSVFDGECVYYCADDGIYKANNFDKAEINKDSSSKLADGKYTSLNFYDGNLFCINSTDNSIYKLSDINNDEKKPYIDKVYTSDPGYTLSCFAINTDNIYVLSNSAGTYYLKSTNLRNKTKINDVWHCEAKDAWMYLNESTLRICASGSNGWTAFKGDIDGNKTSGLQKYCSGEDAPDSVAFYEDKVYVLHSGTSQSYSSISINDLGGNRNDINLDCHAKKILLSGQTAFVQCDNQHYIWFNLDTNMSHDIDNRMFKEEQVKTINILKNYFAVLYSDGSLILTDLDSLT